MRQTIQILIIMMVSSLASAQISIGPRLGMQGASQNLPSPFSVMFPGFQGGVSTMISLGDDLVLQPDIMYSQRGFKLCYCDDFQILRLNFVEVPVSMRYMFGMGNMRFFVQGGFYGAFAMGGQFIEEYNGEETREDYDFEGTGTNKLDLGLVGGGGVQYRTTAGVIVLDLRWNQGMSDLSSTFMPETNQTKVTNQSLGISLAFYFEL